MRSAIVLVVACLAGCGAGGSGAPGSASVVSDAGVDTVLLGEMNAARWISLMDQRGTYAIAVMPSASVCLPVSGQTTERTSAIGIALPLPSGPSSLPAAGMYSQPATGGWTTGFTAEYIVIDGGCTTTTNEVAQSGTVTIDSVDAGIVGSFDLQFAPTSGMPGSLSGRISGTFSATACPTQTWPACAVGAYP